MNVYLALGLLFFASIRGLWEEGKEDGLIHGGQFYGGWRLKKDEFDSPVQPNYSQSIRLVIFSPQFFTNSFPLLISRTHTHTHTRWGEKQSESVSIDLLLRLPARIDYKPIVGFDQRYLWFRGRCVLIVGETSLSSEIFK